MAIYCIDPNNGSNTTGNGSAAAPYLNIAKFCNGGPTPITLVAGDEIRILGDDRHYNLTGAFPTGGQLPPNANPSFGTRAFNGNAWTIDTIGTDPLGLGWSTYYTRGANVLPVVREASTSWIAMSTLPTTGQTAITMPNAVTGTQVAANKFPFVPSITSSAKTTLTVSRPIWAQNFTTTATWGGLAASSGRLLMNVSTAGYSQVVISGGWNSTFDGPQTGDWSTSFSSFINTAVFQSGSGNRSATAPSVNAGVFVMNNGAWPNSLGLEIKNLHLHGVNMWANGTTAILPAGWYKETNCSFNDSALGGFQTPYYDQFFGLNTNGWLLQYYWFNGGWRKGYNHNGFDMANGFGPSAGGSGIATNRYKTGVSIDAANLETTMNSTLLENINIVAMPTVLAPTGYTNGGRGWPVYYKNCNYYSIPGTDNTGRGASSTPTSSGADAFIGLVVLNNAEAKISLKSPLIGLAIMGATNNAYSLTSSAPSPTVTLTSGYAPHGLYYKALGATPVNLVTNTSLYTYTSYFGGMDQVDPMQSGLDFITNVTSTSPTSSSWGTGNAGGIYPLAVTGASILPYQTYMADGNQSWAVTDQTIQTRPIVNHYHNGKLYQYQQNGMVTGINTTVYETGTNSLQFKDITWRFGAKSGGWLSQMAKVWEGTPTSNSNSITIDVRWKVGSPYTEVTNIAGVFAVIVQDNKVIGISASKDTIGTTTSWDPTAQTAWATHTITLSSATYTAGKPLVIYFGGQNSLFSNPAGTISNWVGYNTTNTPDTFALTTPCVINTFYVDRVEVTPTNIWQ